ncbi:RNA polymerase sigma factor [Planctomycetaceae bacterium SH139]
MSSVAPNSAEHPTLSSLLLDGVQAMDPTGWARLVTTFGPIVYRWCRASGVKECDAPDVVQEVFAAVARGITSFQREKTQGSFRSWLATITRNKVRDHYRDLAKRQQAEGGTEALVQLQQFAEDLDSTICPKGVETPLIREVLRQVEAEFEPSTWHAFWLTTIETRKASEVAGELGITAASVYQAKSRVLRRLRGRLSELP